MPIQRFTPPGDDPQAIRNAIARQAEINANASGWGGWETGNGGWASNYAAGASDPNAPVGPRGSPIAAQASGPTNLFGGSEEYVKYKRLPVPAGQPIQMPPQLTNPYPPGSAESEAWRTQVGPAQAGGMTEAEYRRGELRTPPYAPPPMSVPTGGFPPEILDSVRTAAPNFPPPSGVAPYAPPAPPRQPVIKTSSPLEGLQKIQPRPAEGSASGPYLPQPDTTAGPLLASTDASPAPLAGLKAAAPTAPPGVPKADIAQGRGYFVGSKWMGQGPAPQRVGSRIVG